MAKKLSTKLGIEHIELDALHWRPNWEAVPVDEFREAVDKSTDGESWIVDGNYFKKLQDILWVKATHIIWVDPSFPVTFWRALSRTFSRVFTKQELFAGNKESFSKAFLSRDSIIWWVITTYGEKKRRYLKLFEEKNYSNLTYIRLQSNREIEKFLSKL